MVRLVIMFNAVLQPLFDSRLSVGMDTQVLLYKLIKSVIQLSPYFDKTRVWMKIFILEVGEGDGNLLLWSHEWQRTC